MLNPFTPGSTVSRSVSGSSANVQLPSLRGNQIVVTSPADNALAFINFGGSTVTAATTDYPIIPGTKEVLTVPPGSTYAAAIGTSGTLYFTGGDGQ